MEKNSENGTSHGGRHGGYMKIMKQLWEEKGYVSLNLTAQNLRDTVARYEKKQPSNSQIGIGYKKIDKPSQEIDTGHEKGAVTGLVAVNESAPEIIISHNEQRNVDNGPLNRELGPSAVNDNTEIIDFTQLSEGIESMHNNVCNEMQNEEQSFKWNNIDGTEFCSLIDGTYEEIVH